MKSIFLIIIIALLALATFNPKIKICQIIKKHFSTLVNDRNKKISFLDYITFVILPLIISVFSVVILKISITDVNVLLTVFSIFAALLLNFLMLIIQAKDNIEKEMKELKETDKKIETYKKLSQCISQTYYNVSYSILLSIISILLLLLLDIFKITGIFSYILNGSILFTSISFFLCLFMILKRIFILFNEKP